MKRSEWAELVSTIQALDEEKKQRLLNFLLCLQDSGHSSAPPASGPQTEKE